MLGSGSAVGGLRQTEPGEPPFLPIVEVIHQLMGGDYRPPGVLTREEALAYLDAVIACCDAGG